EAVPLDVPEFIAGPEKGRLQMFARQFLELVRRDKLRQVDELAARPVDPVDERHRALMPPEIETGHFGRRRPPNRRGDAALVLVPQSDRRIDFDRELDIHGNLLGTFLLTCAEHCWGHLGPTLRSPRLALGKCRPKGIWPQLI